MLRSWKFTALVLVLATGLLGGCGVKVNDPTGGGGKDYKPSPNDLLGTALDFGGHWQGNCVANVGGTNRSDCSMSMDVNQAAGFMDGTLTVSGSITIGNMSRNFSSPVFGISGNNLSALSGQGAGSIGAGAFRIFEDQFKGFSVKALGKDKNNKMATKIGILATQINGYSLASTSGSSCANSNCFQAYLVLQSR